jgi:hypothetical protein
MPTFPIYVGFSRFEAVEKMNPDIPIGIAKLPRNPDFLKIFLLSRRLTPNFKSRATFFSRQPIRNRNKQSAITCLHVKRVMNRCNYSELPNLVTVFIEEDFNCEHDLTVINYSGDIKMGYK